MTKLLKRIRAVVLMGVMWAVAWLPIGPLIGFIVDRDGSMDEPWIAVGALPGLLGGMAFSIVLLIAERRHRFDALTMPRVTAWGALGGLLVGLAPFVLGDRGGRPFEMWLLLIPISITVMGALSAAGSLALAKRSFSFVDDPASIDELSATGSQTGRKLR